MSVRRLTVVGAREEADLDGAPLLRVALATQDVKSVNAHFGSAKKFAVYEVSATESRFVEALDFESTSDESGSHSEAVDNLTPKIAAIVGCNMLFCLAIGGPAAAKVVRAKIHPIKLSKPEPIETVISRVQTMLLEGAPPWLKKTLEGQRKRSMSFLDEED